MSHVPNMANTNKNDRVDFTLRVIIYCRTMAHNEVFFYLNHLLIQ